MTPIPQNSSRLLFKAIVLFLFGTSFTIPAIGQHSTSANDGNWTTNSTWVGNAVPSTGSTWGSVTIKHDIILTGNLATGSRVITIDPNKTLTIDGNLTTQGGSSINVSGTLIINGNVDLSAPINILPGGQVIIKQNITVRDSNYLNVGTNDSATPYADLVLYGNLNFTGGAATINRNGRVGIFGNVTANGGGINFTVNNGGQVYIHGNVTFGPGGNSVNNNNPSGYGLYINGTTSAGGGGSNITGNHGDQDDMENTNPSFYDWVSKIPMGPLPVTWLSFSVRNIDHKSAYLTWSTASEINAEAFIIERSANGKDYAAIGSVAASGNSRTRQDYAFTDLHPIIGRSYYRLRQVDLDGSFAYSEARSIKLDGRKVVSVYPNPVQSDELKVQLNFSDEAEVFVSVYDVSGMEIDQFRFHGTAFARPLHLKAGTYVLKASAGSDKLICRFVVR